MHAVGRIAYHGWIDNIQASWVKMGIEARISCSPPAATISAGLSWTRTSPGLPARATGSGWRRADFRALAESVGRRLEQRTTLYGRVAPSPPELVSPESDSGFQRRASRASSTELLDLTGARANRDLLRDILVTGLALGNIDASRLDLKIAASALAEMGRAFELFAPYRGISQADHVRLRPHRRLRPALRPGRRSRRRGWPRESWMVVTGAGPGIMAAGTDGAGSEMSLGVEIRLPFETASHPQLAAEGRLVEMKYFFTRKLMLMKESAAFAVLPGGFGTLDECFELLTLAADRQGRAGADRPAGPPRRSLLGRARDVRQRRSGAPGLVDPDDDAPSTASPTTSPLPSQEILGFYRNYQSRRFVGSTMVIRCRSAPTDEELATLNEEFADICSPKGIWRTNPPPPSEPTATTSTSSASPSSSTGARTVGCACSSTPSTAGRSASLKSVRLAGPGVRVARPCLPSAARPAWATSDEARSTALRARESSFSRRGPGRSWRACRLGAAGRAASRRPHRRAVRRARRARLGSHPGLVVHGVRGAGLASAAGRSIVTTSRSPFDCSERSTFLSNLPTLVFGISLTNAHRSGTHQRGTLSPSQEASSSAEPSSPCFKTTHARGRSSQRGSGTATTAASKTAGCAIRAFSRSTEEIHSPPVLMTSFVRSVICK